MLSQSTTLTMLNRNGGVSFSRPAAHFRRQRTNANPTTQLNQRYQEYGRKPSQKGPIIGILVALFALAAVPIWNMISLYSGIISLQLLASENASKIGGTESVQAAKKILQDTLSRYEDPALNWGHRVHVDRESALLSVVISKQMGRTEVVPISDLSAEGKPSHPGNEVNNYNYRVQVNCSIEPPINLSCVPLIGSIPGLGMAQTVPITADATVEHKSALD